MSLFLVDGMKEKNLWQCVVTLFMDTPWTKSTSQDNSYMILSIKEEQWKDWAIFETCQLKGLSVQH